MMMQKRSNSSYNRLRDRVALVSLAFALWSGMPVLAEQSVEGRGVNMGTVATVKKEDVQRILVEGNQRYVEGKTTAGPLSPKERAALAAGQRPIATIITCADSRVEPNFIFDQPEGKLFVCRVAGNVVDKPELGSIEYGTEHLHVQFILVLGHTGCGAVKAACESHGEASENVGSIIEKIHPSVERVGKKPDENARIDAVVEENVRAVVKEIMSSSSVGELVEKGEVVIKGAVYDLETGKVKFLEE